MEFPLFTIGHGSTPFDDLLHRLEVHGIRTVIDVRSQPYSSYAPHYSKAELDSALVAAGRAYRWLGHHLGGRPIREGGKAPIDDEVLLAAGVTEAAGLARGASSALLCAEVDPGHCHRTTALSPAFEAAGFTVRHILGDGTLRLHQPTLEL